MLLKNKERGRVGATSSGYGEQCVLMTSNPSLPSCGLIQVTDELNGEVIF